MSPDILAPTLKCVILWFIIQSNYGALRGVLVPFRIHILRTNLTNVAAVMGDIIRIFLWMPTFLDDRPD